MYVSCTLKYALRFIAIQVLMQPEDYIFKLFQIEGINFNKVISELASLGPSVLSLHRHPGGFLSKYLHLKTQSGLASLYPEDVHHSSSAPQQEGSSSSSWQNSEICGSLPLKSQNWRPGKADQQIIPLRKQHPILGRIQMTDGLTFIG